MTKFALASRIHWERRLPAGTLSRAGLSRAGLSATPTTMAATVSRLKPALPVDTTRAVVASAKKWRASIVDRRP